MTFTFGSSNAHSNNINSNLLHWGLGKFCLRPGRRLRGFKRVQSKLGKCTRFSFLYFCIQSVNHIPLCSKSGILYHFSHWCPLSKWYLSSTLLTNRMQWYNILPFSKVVYVFKLHTKLQKENLVHFPNLDCTLLFSSISEQYIL